ncbi:MAG: DUF3226 domain-containing protein [Caldilineaceae bacterium]
MAPRNSLAQLVVEGKTDQHVIWALCKKYDVQETFTVEPPSATTGGIEYLLDGLPVRLKAASLRALGIVIDADFDISAQWGKVRSRLISLGYEIPLAPTSTGTIVHLSGRPTVGIWVMPNNILPGMLENFAAHLIEPDDPLAEKVTQILDIIESSNLNRYSLAHRPKAYIHTWLAWQEIPGQPMGQAITANVLNNQSVLVQSFIDWLTALFGQSAQ